jgi:hypothetical protein
MLYAKPTPPLTIGRNDSCFCGSGSKYKKCCMNKTENERRLIFEDIDNPVVNEWLFYYYPIREFSAAMLMHARLATPEITQLASSFTRSITSRGEEEAEQIRVEQNPMNLLEMLRSGLDNINYDLLISRLSKYESQVMPALLEKLWQTEDDVLIEQGIQYLYQCSEFPLHEIEKLATEAPNPYLRSTLCMLLGFKGPETVLPIIWRQFHFLRKQYPSENYLEWPLYGLDEYGRRFGLL